MVYVRNNYKMKYKDDIRCPLCGETTGELDTQQHLLLCLKLQDGKTQIEGSNYPFIFYFNLEKMMDVVIQIEAALSKQASLI